MGKAVVKLYIATYAEDQYVVTVNCKKSDLDEEIIAKAWKKAKEQEGGSLPYGARESTILKRD